MNCRGVGLKGYVPFPNTKKINYTYYVIYIVLDNYRYSQNHLRYVSPPSLWNISGSTPGVVVVIDKF